MLEKKKEEEAAKIKNMYTYTPEYSQNLSRRYTTVIDISFLWG